ncbi:methyltransferase, partial [Escherichia coli]|uniref:methyltransferase n=1 Tax=Escherichia coli TaxID=562 RepID=UPI003891C299
MHSQLRERIRLMRARLDNAAPVAEIRAESQLFVTPAPVCDRLVTLAEISNRDHILEPSAGTGAILRAIRDTAPEAMCDAVEINSGLVRYLRENFNGVRVQCGDFMEWQPVQYYSRIIMNPPFSHGQDIRHTCMTMEQANEKAKKLERSSEAKPVAASLPRLAEGNFRTMPVQ